MLDLHVIDKVTKVFWTKHFHDNENSLWKKYIIDKLGIGNTKIFFRCNFSEYMIPNYSKLPLFYREVISNWKIVQYQNTSTLEEIKSQFVWYNSNLFNENCPQYFSNSLFQAGIWYINDLYDHFGKLIPFSSWLTRGVSPRDYLIWRKVAMTVRNKIIIQGAEAANIDAFMGICVLNQKISLDKLNSKKLKLFYTHKVLKSIESKTGYKNINWYNSKYGKLSDAEWENIFILPHILPVENKVKEMQYKILFRYVPTNKLLYKIKKKTSPNCHMCLSSIRTIEHLFFECSIVKTFWALLWESLGKDTGNTKLDINLKHIILGFKWEKVAQNREINIIILKEKYYIFLCHINEKELI